MFALPRLPAHSLRRRALWPTLGCAAALLVDAGLVGNEIQIRTGAGLKHLKLIERRGRLFLFEMNMGTPAIAEGNLEFLLKVAGSDCECTILDVGNPQCAFFVPNFDSPASRTETFASHRRLPSSMFPSQISR